MKTKIILILCVVVLAACKKKETENEPTVEQKTYIKKFTYTSGEITWNYNAQNQLNTIVFVSANEASNPSNTYKVNSFNSKGAIVEATVDHVSPSITDYKQVNTYNTEGNLIRSELFNMATGATINYTIIEYLANNQVRNTQYNQDNLVNQSTLYIRSSDGKNVIEMRGYTSVGVLSYTYLYSNFDTKKTATNLYPKGYSTSSNSENNFQSQSLTLGTAGVATNQTFTYEYNADNYRTKRTSSSGTVDTYEYIKK